VAVFLPGDFWYFDADHEIADLPPRRSVTAITAAIPAPTGIRPAPAPTEEQDKHHGKSDAEQDRTGPGLKRGQKVTEKVHATSYQIWKAEV
jgi:hypothetical protein